MNIIRTTRKIVSKIDIEFSTKIMYWAFLHKKLNLKTPTTFNEKLCWLKLNYFPNDELVIKCTDKSTIRDYLKKIHREDLSVKILGIWKNADEICWNDLPDKFVLKCTHGCAYNIICTDKKELNKDTTVKKLNRWLKEDFGLVSGEPHYSKIMPQIICEEFIEGDLIDYKFFCFNGNPKFYYTAVVPSGDFHSMMCDFFWLNGEVANFYRKDHKRLETIPEKPENLEEMIDLAKKLSSAFPFVRVDFMFNGHKLYLSELTFTPSAGIMPLAPAEADAMIGEWLDLSLFKNVGK